MTPKERAAMQQALEALVDHGTAYLHHEVHYSEAITALREALDHSLKPKCFADYQPNHAIDRACALCPVAAECQTGEQAEQRSDSKRMEPVAKTALKNCIYFDNIDFTQTPPYLRYDTGDSTAKKNWDEYCTIQECLREYGYKLTDSDVDHDTVCGDVTRIVEQAEQKPVAWHHPQCEGQCIACLIEKAVQDAYGTQGRDYMLRHINAAPVQQVDLTDDEIEALFPKPWIELMTIKEFVRAVIAADREKNK